MNRIISIIAIVSATIGGIILYKKNSHAQVDEKIVCIFSSNISGTKEDIRSIRQALQLYNIKREQIVENPISESGYIKIFFDQQKFDEYIKKDDSSLKIAVRLQKHSEEENSRITGIFANEKNEALFELIEIIVKKPISCLLVYDENSEYSKHLVTQYQELANIKEIKLRLCPISSNRNVSSALKEVDYNINAVIVIPGQIIFQDAERILEYFKIHKIPVFANHSGLVRSGALGGYDFDTTEIAHSIAEVISNFLKDTEKVETAIFDTLYQQLHLNMDTINYLNIQLDSDLLDEAVTVGGADL